MQHAAWHALKSDCRLSLGVGCSAKLAPTLSCKHTLLQCFSDSMYVPCMPCQACQASFWSVLVGLAYDLCCLRPAHINTGINTCMYCTVYACAAGGDAVR